MRKGEVGNTGWNRNIGQLNIFFVHVIIETVTQ